MNPSFVRSRMIVLREHRGWSQANLAAQLGFNDRQTLSEIERGGRAISADELLRVAEVFGVTLEHLTDPLTLVGGEGMFSWRKADTGTQDLDAFEEKAGGWIALYRYLRQLKGEATNSSLTRIAITNKSVEEDAAAEGEILAHAWELGDVPALTLRHFLENKMATLVLQVDPIPGVSGAACQLGSLNTILINRSENEGRRAFNLGHELFHLLTWSDFPPSRIDTGRRKIERLANSFASGILMPRYAVERAMGLFPKPTLKTEYSVWIRQLAAYLHVSGQALKRRLSELGVITRASSERVSDESVQVDIAGETKPLLMSVQMMETLGWALERGHISIRRCARVLDVTIDDLADLFRGYGIPSPFEI